MVENIPQLTIKTNKMTNFKVGDKFAHVRKSAGTDRIIEILDTGTITKGPFEVEKINHYNVEWDNIKNENWANSKFDIICDIDSKKYGYRLLDSVKINK
jgi:hypothetical protein